MQERLCWQVRVEVEGEWVYSETIFAHTAEAAAVIMERANAHNYSGLAKCRTEDFVDIDFTVAS